MRFIDEHRDTYAVALLLRVLDVDQSTYYAWLKRVERPSDRELVDRGLLSNIYEIWTDSGRVYGSDRVWRQLRRDGILIGRKRVERLMRMQGWQGAFLRRGWRHGSTRQDPEATPSPELVYRTSLRSRDEAENALFAYIDGWYNTRRIQAGLGDRSPDEYEAAWYTATIDQPGPPGTTLEPTGAR